MNIEKYKRQLQMEEKRLVKEMGRNISTVQQTTSDATGDAADRSIQGEQKEDQFQEMDTETSALHHVRDALQRIEDGTYGKCIVDGGPIDEKRLDALPWTPYCIQHQQSMEKTHPPHTTPTV